MDKSLYKKVVIVFLHNDFNSYLLQLRDFKSSIIFPGHWGAFGGAIEEGESPIVALSRELTEEIGYSPETFNFFREVNKDQQKLNIHMFFSPWLRFKYFQGLPSLKYYTLSIGFVLFCHT